MQALATNENAGLVMDFDGVLSRITDDPDASELLPGTEKILASLATKLSVVALLSGRPARFLAERATIPGIELYGSYGLEHLSDNGIKVVPEAREWMTAVEQATETLHQELDGVEGIYVEDKSLAVAVHWRRASDRDSATKLITPLIQKMIGAYGLRHEPGKFVEELRMPLKQDKGTALEMIVSTKSLQTVAYAGDDRGDLPAFDAATAGGGYALVIHGADIAPDVRKVSGAHFDGPEEFQSWLQQLNDAVR